MNPTSLISPCLICDNAAVKTVRDETNLLALLYKTLKCHGLLSLEINREINNSDFCETCSSALICSMNILQRIEDLNASLEEIRLGFQKCLLANYKKVVTRSGKGSRLLVQKTLAQCLSACRVNVIPLEERDDNRILEASGEREGSFEEIGKYEENSLEEENSPEVENSPKHEDFPASSPEIDVAAPEDGFGINFDVQHYCEVGFDGSSTAAAVSPDNAKDNISVPASSVTYNTSVSEEDKGSSAPIISKEQEEHSTASIAPPLKRKCVQIRRKIPWKSQSSNEVPGEFDEPDWGAKRRKRAKKSKNPAPEQLKQAQKFPHYCEICETGFMKSQSYIAHQNRHLGNFPYPCPFCEKKYVYGWKLYKHIRLRHKDKQQEYFARRRQSGGANCPHRGLTFSLSGPGENQDQAAEAGLGSGKVFKAATLTELSSYRSSHVRNCYSPFSRAPQVRFPCDICNKTFSTARNLRVHVDSVHKKVFRHRCDLCGKGFQIGSNLRRHMTTHGSPVKNFKCDVCTKAFRTEKYLLVHKQRHQKVRTLICEICGKGCFDSRALRIHTAVHQDRKEYPCKFCNKLFACKEYVLVHVRQMHKSRKEETDALK